MYIFFTGRNVVNTKDLSQARVKSLNAVVQVVWEEEVKRELGARDILGKEEMGKETE